MHDLRGLAESSLHVGEGGLFFNLCGNELPCTGLKLRVKSHYPNLLYPTPTLTTPNEVSFEHFLSLSQHCKPQVHTMEQMLHMRLNTSKRNSTTEHHML